MGSWRRQFSVSKYHDLFIFPFSWLCGAFTFKIWTLKVTMEVTFFPNSRNWHLTIPARLMSAVWIPARKFSSVQLLSRVRLCDPMNCSTPGLPVHHQIPEFTQTHVHQVGDAIQPSYPLLSPSAPAPNPSQHQGPFQWVNSSHEVAKVLNFSFSISPSSEHPGLISRMDWLDLLAVQRTLKSFF